MEVLGTYDPIPKDPIPGLYPHASSTSPTASPLTTPSSSIEAPDLPRTALAPRKYKDIRLDTARTKYWLGVGAQPSEPVWKLLSMLGLVERAFRGEELRKRAGEADERHREYWASRGLGVDGKTPLRGGGGCVMGWGGGTWEAKFGVCIAWRMGGSCCLPVWEGGWWV